MEKPRFLPRVRNSDGLAALLLALGFLILARGPLHDPVQRLERAVYDVALSSRSVPAAQNLVVVAIDDESLAAVGRWPWPRDRHAELIERLSAAGAAWIVSTVFYSEAQEGAGLAEIEALESWLAGSELPQALPEALALLDPGLAERHRQAVAEFGSQLNQARLRLAPDQQLAKAIRDSGRVLLPMSVEFGPAAGGLPAMPESLLEQGLGFAGPAAGQAPSARSLNPPLAELAEAAAGVGHLNVIADVDGALRFTPLVVNYAGAALPSLALLAAARGLGIEPDAIRLPAGHGVDLGAIRLATTPARLAWTHFYPDRDGHSPFTILSAQAVLSDPGLARMLRDRVVIIGATAAGVGDRWSSPVSTGLSPALVLAHTVSSLMQNHVYRRTASLPLVELGVLLALAAYLGLGLARIPPLAGAAASAVLLLALLGSEIGLLQHQGLWLKLVGPALFLVVGHLLLTIRRLRKTETDRDGTEAQSAESNRLLGLTFQGQGQLDLAYEKFLRVQPVDHSLLELFYNLGLDFERKRQFNKAESVYRQIAAHQRSFRDVADRLIEVRRWSDTQIFGTRPGQGSLADPLRLAADGLEKPMLGRYLIDRELGQGAMGSVYLGQDPKIARRVAIKTLNLGAEQDAEQRSAIRARFFREAETAGRLNHPQIVQIFDAGEDQDLAYIAMEYVEGEDLSQYTRPERLLDVGQVLGLVADAAEALDHAHHQGVIHRDIKPSNLMRPHGSRSIKITDFGIARLSDFNRTRTGTVLGTPSYMSPEQITGAHVDGRSDLFSLGVSLYQLLTGTLPFQAESLTTLMYKITHETPIPASRLRPGLPAGLDPILARALQKKAEDRYSRGAEMAAALRPLIAGG